MSDGLHLDKLTKQYCFASYRTSGWHNLGTVTQEEVSIRRMLEMAHGDFKVNKTEIFCNVTKRSGEPIASGWNKDKDEAIYTYQPTEFVNKIEDTVALYREDTGDILSLVGNDYSIFQNEDMAAFFENLATDHHIVPETCGLLGNGEKIWMLCSIPGYDLSVGEDEIFPYLMISNTHNRTECICMMGTTIRVVCRNTLRMAMRNSKNTKTLLGQGWHIKHTKNMNEAVKDVQQQWQGILDSIKITKELYQLLATIPATKERRQEVWKVVTKGDDEGKQISKRKATSDLNINQRLEEIFISPNNSIPVTQGTLFAALQTANEYIDHEGRIRKLEGNSDSEEFLRWKSANFGSGDMMKERVFDKVLELAGV
jgi:phage/plasmid-like protein (TIGR03299 family)